jgi:gliding motility-associated-like protein
MKKNSFVYPVLVLIFLFNSNSFAVTLMMPDTSGLPGELITMPVIFSDTVNSRVAGADIIISYNPDILDITGVNNTVMTSGFSLLDSISDGSIGIVLARATGITDTLGPFLEIECQVKLNAQATSQSPLTFSRINLYDESGNSVATQIINGSVTVIGEVIDEEEKLTVLPNPFTPNNDSYNDVVNFNLSSNAIGNPTEIQIFDISGKLVRTIHQELVWDGMDNSNQSLKPGVYVYILKLNGKTKFNGTVTLMR